MFLKVGALYKNKKVFFELRITVCRFAMAGLFITNADLKY
jgi:hypothetical protein